jgi:TolB-like protein/DNA-binding SARP family transcriptional activator
LTEGPAHWSLRLLGGFDLVALSGGERVALPGKRERVLLAYLAFSPNGRQPRRKLAALLWGDAGDETALDNLRTCVWSLRKALGDGEHRIIASEGEDIVLDASAFDVDVLAFRRLAAQSGRVELETAAKICSGEFLDGLGIESEEFETWRRGEATRYRDQTIDVLSRLMVLFSESGESECAIATGARILRLEPLHEAAVRRLMRLYGESGRRGAAVQLYRSLADALRTELDAQPEAETRTVYAEIARGGGERTRGQAAADAAPTHTATIEPASPAFPLAPVRSSFRMGTPIVILAGVLILAITFISYRQFLGPQGVVAERAASAYPATAISIAVMPFLNFSGDVTQEFFSDGMTEEITAALAKVPDLKVVARTSAFQFKGEKNDMRAVGRALNATHLIEGSVRREGSRVRITAQLIEVAKGTHLWSENYDRQLSDIFATQEEIARTIVSSLMTPLGLAPGERLVSNRNIDPESYQQYLQAKPLVSRRGNRPLIEAAALLEKVVARNPDFAPGWALLAQAYAWTPNTHPAQLDLSSEALRRVVDEFLPKAEASARRAIQLDPDYADGFVALGLVQEFRGRLLQAQELYSKALMLDPSNPDALHRSSTLVAAAGQVKDSIAMRQKLRALEPFVPSFNMGTFVSLWLDGQNEAAVAVLKDLPDGTPWAPYYFARAYAAMGHFSKAADALSQFPPEMDSKETAQVASRLLRTALASTSPPATIPRLGNMSFVHLYLRAGVPERSLEPFERNVEAGYLASTYTAELWHPSAAALRKTERFKTFVRKTGLVEYWRAKGWPEFCRPKGTDDFVCA